MQFLIALYCDTVLVGSVLITLFCLFGWLWPDEKEPLIPVRPASLNRAE